MSCPCILDHPFTACLIARVAGRLCRRGEFLRSELDDLRQDMLCHLWFVRGSYDPAHGSVEGFVTVQVRRWVSMELRRRRCQKRGGGRRPVSLDAPAANWDGRETPLCSLVSQADLLRRTGGGGGPSAIALLHLKEAVQPALGRLGQDDREFLMHVIEHGKRSAAREWSRRSGLAFSKRRGKRRLAGMQHHFEDYRPCAN